jgi:hypothetical protein
MFWLMPSAMAPALSGRRILVARDCSDDGSKSGGGPRLVDICCVADVLIADVVEPSRSTSQMISATMSITMMV